MHSLLRGINIIKTITATVTASLSSSNIASFPTRWSATSRSLPVRDNNNRHCAFSTSPTLSPSFRQQDLSDETPILIPLSNWFRPDDNWINHRALGQHSSISHQPSLPQSLEGDLSIKIAPRSGEPRHFSNIMARHCIDLTSEDEWDDPPLPPSRIVHRQRRDSRPHTQGTLIPTFLVSLFPSLLCSALP